jgi:prepilin-type N-terminal cleavage/methylation domain-containing protein
MKCSSCHISKATALTLLELLVVVAILAVLASIAVRVTGDVESETRIKASQESLAGIKSAILGEVNSSGGFGGSQTMGFVSDIGRVPRARTVVGADFSYLALTELYSLSNPGLRSYQVWTNTASNLVIDGDVAPAGTSTHLTDSNLRIPSGWRGPYLRLKSVQEGIRDGWSKEIVSLPQGLTSAEATLWPVGLLKPYSGGVTLVDLGADYELVVSNGLPVYGAFFRSGFDGGQSVGVDTAGLYREVVSESDFSVPAAFSVSISTSFPALGSVGGATHRLIVAMYGPNPEMSGSAPPIRATLRVLNYHDTNVFTVNGSFIGNGGTIGPKVFRAILFRGGTSFIKGSPVYANLSTANDLVRLTIP